MPCEPAPLHRQVLKRAAERVGGEYTRIFDDKSFGIDVVEVQLGARKLPAFSLRSDELQGPVLLMPFRNARGAVRGAGVTITGIPAENLAVEGAAIAKGCTTLPSSAYDLAGLPLDARVRFAGEGVVTDGDIHTSGQVRIAFARTASGVDLDVSVVERQPLLGARFLGTANTLGHNLWSDLAVRTGASPMRHQRLQHFRASLSLDDDAARAWLDATLSQLQAPLSVDVGALRAALAPRVDPPVVQVPLVAHLRRERRRIGMLDRA
jgi:hypothetical protein